MDATAQETRPAASSTAVPNAKPLAGSLLAAFVASLCCGGSLLWGLFGLAALYRTLKLWQYVPEFLGTGALLIVAINYLYYRRKARLGCDAPACAPLRQAMFVSVGLSLVFMVGSFVFLTWLNHAVVNAERFMRMAKYAEALIPGVPNAELFYAVASLIGGMVLLAVLPFPRPREPAGAA
jgi:hypothetical protein